MIYDRLPTYLCSPLHNLYRIDFLWQPGAEISHFSISANFKSLTCSHFTFLAIWSKIMIMIEPVCFTFPYLGLHLWPNFSYLCCASEYTGSPTSNFLSTLVQLLISLLLQLPYSIFNLYKSFMLLFYNDVHLPYFILG